MTYLNWLSVKLFGNPCLFFWRCGWCYLLLWNLWILDQFCFWNLARNRQNRTKDAPGEAKIGPRGLSQTPAWRVRGAILGGKQEQGWLVMSVAILSNDDDFLRNLRSKSASWPCAIAGGSRQTCWTYAIAGGSTCTCCLKCVLCFELGILTLRDCRCVKLWPFPKVSSIASGSTFTCCLNIKYMLGFETRILTLGDCRCVRLWPFHEVSLIARAV